MENLEGWDHSEDHPDFDPNLLNVESWGVDHHQTDDVHVNVNVNSVTEQHDTSDSRNSRLHSRKKNIASSGNWGDSQRHIDQWSNLAVTEFDHHEVNAVSTSKHDGSSNSNINSVLNNNNNRNNMHLQQASGVVGIRNETLEAAVEAAVAAISETSESVTSGDRSGGSFENNTYDSISQHLHPLGIQSSASCPAPAYAGGSNFHQQQHQQVQQHAQQHQQHQQHQQNHQQQHQQHTIQAVCGVGLSQPLESSVSGPSGISTTGAATTTPQTITNAPAATQHLSSLAANFVLAQAANSTVAATAAAAANDVSSATTTGATAQDHQRYHTASVISQPSTIPSSSVSNSAKSKTGRAASSRQRNNGARKSRSTKTKKKKTNTSKNAANDTNTLPPFYLFDAPVELRANFMQNQRRLGLPIQHDPNSYHYGETVNGFHPHQYQLPFGANASNTDAGVAGVGVPPPVRSSDAPPPQLIDARHGIHRRNKGGQVKNEREQKRAQKITELIEQLRLQMEEGGWQVEARSKFHTLSKCAQYMKHMIKLTSDKEIENEKLNGVLDEKRDKIERENEEKAMQEERSDPESVTSSMTSDTTMSTARNKQDEEMSGESGGDVTKKRKLSNTSNLEGGSSGEDSINNVDTNINKKHRITSSEATTEDSSGDDNRGGSGSDNSRTGSGSGGSGSGSGGPSAQGCSISKTISSVSELTDSNRDSSSNNSGSREGSSDDIPTEQDSRESTSGGADQLSTSSISSDAAVASEKTSRNRNTGHKDVVFHNDKRMSQIRPPEEVTSLERTFELNYEEVFNKSNIPQLIASTSGKIVTWNECFCKATGYRKSEIERMTIFSLVKPENLAKFFEIVAAALRPDDEDSKNLGCTDVDSIVTKKEEESSAKSEEAIDLENIVSGNSANEESSSDSTEEEVTNKIATYNVSGNSTNEESSSNSAEEERTNKIDEDELISKHLLNYTAMTLPCIDFPGMKKRNEAATESNSVTIPPLHVTVTLMSDKDPSRRCFHCVFTNSKGTNGSLGIITPELLASLFAKPLRNSRRKKNHYSSDNGGANQHQRKRARGGTTRIGQSVSTSYTENYETKHCDEHHEMPPSPLLMPPPGPPTENNSNREEIESKIFKTEMAD